MADNARPVQDVRGNLVGWKGSKAGQNFAGDEEIKRKKFDDSYDAVQGASGIAGGGKRATPAYKAKKAEAHRMRSLVMKEKPSLPKVPLLTDLAKKK